MELFEARGFAQTGVADIAARAGLTERTFFNCFPDKREVLFHGAEKLESFLVVSVAQAPASASATEAVAAALDTVVRASDAAPEFADFARRRHALLQLHAELHERELSKLASLASAMAGALRLRGVPARSANLAAEVGIAVFKVAFETYTSDPKRRKLAFHLRESLDDFAMLKVVSKGTGPASPRGGAGVARKGRSLRSGR